MSWIQTLYETYEACAGKDFPNSDPLLPIAHTTQQAHIEIVLDGEGNFRRAALVQKENASTVLPATESSAGRTSGEAAHPLSDKIQYCAGDYAHFGGQKKPYFASYLTQLKAWCESPYAHPKAKAVLVYVEKRTLIADLAQHGVLVVADGILAVNEKSGGEKSRSENDASPPGIFKLLVAKDGAQDQGDAFIRWIVEDPGHPCSKAWEDKTLFKSWQEFEASRQQKTGFCMVTGDTQGILAEQHPAKLRHGADKAKLISSNDTNGFTYLGRFTTADEVAGVSFEVTQKAHNALRWLIARKQAYRNGDQVFVSWAVKGEQTPDPFANSMEFLGFEEDVTKSPENALDVEIGDVGQAYSLRLNRAIAGYKAKLDDHADIVVMGLDSATPGRVAIVFYRELKGAEFLACIQNWHASVAWIQNFGKDAHFTGAPAPHDIAQVAYGRRLDNKLKKATIERLLPCMVDGRPLPKDLVETCTRRAFNRVGMEHWEWEKALGIACALYKGYHHERSYQMALEEERTSRDYLYGRLLAVAERMESIALNVAGETRDTMAARLMQRFADRPYSTWRILELSLTPYKTRLRAKRPAFLWKMEQLLDRLTNSFSTENEKESFTNDRALSGEFLLGYHCQRETLHGKIDQEDVNNTEASAL